MATLGAPNQIASDLKLPTLQVIEKSETSLSNYVPSQMAPTSNPDYAMRVPTRPRKGMRAMSNLPIARYTELKNQEMKPSESHLAVQ